MYKNSCDGIVIAVKHGLSPRRREGLHPDSHTPGHLLRHHCYWRGTGRRTQEPPLERKLFSALALTVPPPPRSSCSYVSAHLTLSPSKASPLCMNHRRSARTSTTTSPSTSPSAYVTLPSVTFLRAPPGRSCLVQRPPVGLGRQSARPVSDLHEA